MKLREYFNKKRFEYAVSAIERTQPVKTGKESFTVLSMVQHRDLMAYLLALKSFVRYSSPERIVLIADPTLTGGDREQLLKHVPDIEIREVADFRHPDLPVGGCWERLCAISRYVADSYVVQLDADTVTIQDVPEVLSAIRDRASFILGTDEGEYFVTCEEAAEFATQKIQKYKYDHVQLLAESMLDRISLDNITQYVRGCAGFSGFSPGSFDTARMVAISRRMCELLGTRWSAWGTEQFTSNLIVSNTSYARVLPHPKYCMPDVRNRETAFLHFIGYQRYVSGLYAQMASQVARDLSSTQV